MGCRWLAAAGRAAGADSASAVPWCETLGVLEAQALPAVSLPQTLRVGHRVRMGPPPSDTVRPP